MRNYIIRRLLLVIPTVFIVTLIVFFMIRMVRGDAIDFMAQSLAAQGGGGGMAAALEKIRHELGLDAPILVQYGRWIGFLPQADGGFSGLFQGDLGHCIFRPIL